MILIREFLNKEHRLVPPDQSGCYQNFKVIGSGSSCVVYRTEFTDSSGFVTEHLLKEYDPVFLHIARRPDGSLVPDEPDREAYNAGLNRFRNGYTLQQDIRRIEGLTNSTSNIQRVFDACGTAYIDMTVMAGQAYARVEEPDLYQLLRHMKALTRVIGNYHRAGFLHLDIKPDNIFVYPETPEMLLLFDFDSVVPKDAVSSGTGLSYTRDWAAPEQLTPSRQSRICEATDLYSIGEILFTRIFGQHSEAADRRSFSSFNYDMDSPLLQNVNPRLFPLLTELLHRTLCGTPEKRYQSADELLCKLDELIPLADPALAFVRGNFTYQSAGFYGREDLLCEVHAFFRGQCREQGNVLFLSGVGGIGKTELARRYAWIHRGEYVRILFLPFQNSMEETLCQSALEIYPGSGSADETEPAPAGHDYSSTLRLLKKDLTPQDLLILDNFDSFDEKIQDLLELNCRILVTTRLDFSDYNLPQRAIHAMQDANTLWEIFRQYNSLDYSETERTQIDQLMEQVDYHTMTICLIAKYLRVNGESPSVLLDALKTSEGITAAQSSTHVGHRKDRRMTNESVQKHLRILFDLSHFSQSETNLLAAFSLFGPVRIAHSTLRELLGSLYQKDILQSLVKTGWVELSGDDIVSLHQIILDLAYTTLVQKCTVFEPVVQGVGQYLQDGNQSSSSQLGKRTLARLFLERIQEYSDTTGHYFLPVADLYCRYHELEPDSADALDKAEQTCRQFSSQESRDLLFRINCTRIIDAGRRYNDSYWETLDHALESVTKNTVLGAEMAAWRILFPQEEDSPAAHMDAAAYLAQLATPDASVCDAADTANLSAFLAHVPVLPALDSVRPEIFDKLMALAHALESAAAECSDLQTELAETDISYRFYLDESCILRYAYLLAVTTGQAPVLLEQLLTALSEFYSESDYGQYARWSCFSDPLKTAFYSFELKRLHDLRSPDVIQTVGTCWGDSYAEAASYEELSGNYQGAIDLLQAALEHHEEPKDTILSQLSWNYIWLYLDSGRLQDVYDCLCDQLAYDRAHHQPDLLTLTELAEVCGRLGRNKEGANWYTALLDEHLASYETLETEDKARVLLSYCQRTELDAQYRMDDALARWVYERLLEFTPESGFPLDLVTVYQRMADPLVKLIGFHDAVRFLLNAADRFRTVYNHGADALYAIVCDLCQQEGKEPKLCFATALKAVDIVFGEQLPNRPKFLALLEQLSQKPEQIPELDLERYHVLQVDLYRDQPDYDHDVMLRLKKNCNYYLLAEHDAAKCSSLWDTTKVWRGARDKYYDIGDDANARRCCLRLDALLSHSDDPELLSWQLEHYERLSEIELRLGNLPGMYQCLNSLYPFWCRPPVQEDSAENDILYSMQTAERDTLSSMQTVTRQFAQAQETLTAVFIGLLRIHRLLAGPNFSALETLPGTDPQVVRMQITQLTDALPDTVPDACRDDVQETLQVIAPLYRADFPESSAAFDRFQKACAFQEVEEKHPQ